MTAHVAVVTGGSRGIGRAIVERMYADGAQVVTCGRGDRPAYLPDDVRWVRADVARPDDVSRLVADAHDAFGPVSALVNNAGVLVARTVADSTDDDWDQQVGVNCRGVFNTSRAVLPDMTEHGGVIVNIGSISGVVADLSSALYNASKAFVHALTRSIAIDHGPQVRCNAVLPGWIETDMTAPVRTPEMRTFNDEILARTPAGRWGQSEEVAGAAVFLASRASQFVTGETIRVDGGYSIR